VQGKLLPLRSVVNANTSVSPSRNRCKCMAAFPKLTIGNFRARALFRAHVPKQSRSRKKPANALRPVATLQMPALKALAESSKSWWTDEVETEAIAAQLELERAQKQGQTFH
jgi:hypothetical protein